MINKNGLLLIIFLSVLVRSEIVKPQLRVPSQKASFKQGTTKEIIQTDNFNCLNSNCSTKNYDRSTAMPREKEAQLGRFKFRKKFQGNGATQIKHTKTLIESEFIGLDGRAKNPSRNLKQQNTIILRNTNIRQITIKPIENKAVKSTTRLFDSAILKRFEYKSYKKSDVKEVVHSSIKSTLRPKNFEVVGFENPKRLKFSPRPFGSTRNIKFRTNKQAQPVIYRTTTALIINNKRRPNKKSPTTSNSNIIFITGNNKNNKRTTKAEDETDYSETTDSETESEDDSETQTEKQKHPSKTTKKLSQKLTTKSVHETTKKRDVKKPSQNIDKTSGSGKPKKPEKEDNVDDDGKKDQDDKNDDKKKGDDEEGDQEDDGENESGQEEDAESESDQEIDDEGEGEDEESTDEPETTVAMRKTTKYFTKLATSEPNTKAPTKPVTLPLLTTKMETPAINTVTKKTLPPSTIQITTKAATPATILATTKIADPTTIPATKTQVFTSANAKTDPPTTANTFAEITSSPKSSSTIKHNIINTEKPNAVKTENADQHEETESENTDIEPSIVTVATKSGAQISFPKTEITTTTELATTKQQEDVDMAEIMVVPKVSQKISEYTKIPEDYENYNLDEAAKAVQATTKKNPAALLGMFSSNFGVEKNDTQQNSSSSSNTNSLLSAASSVISGSGGLSNVLKNVNLGKLFGG